MLYFCSAKASGCICHVQKSPCNPTINYSCQIREIIGKLKITTMSIKQFLLGATMLFTASAFAQQSQPAADANEKAVPVQAHQLELAGQLVRYGYQTKSALPLIQAVQIYKSLNVGEASDDRAKQSEGVELATGLTKTDLVSFDEAKILADATKFADGNKTLLALIKDSEKSTRGAVPGPIRKVDRVLGGYTDTWTIRFRGGEAAYIVVSGDGDTDLDLYVYDQNGNLIAYDNDGIDDCVVSFTPKWTGTFYVKIKNLGRVYNRYELVTN